MVLKNSIEMQIKSVSEKFLKTSKNKEIYILGHCSTDGIVSSAIIIRILRRLDKEFTLKTIKNFEEQLIYDLPKKKLILFLDLHLNSSHLNCIKESGLQNVFIIDHSQITEEIPEHIQIINPKLHNKNKINSAGLAYLFGKELDPKNKDLSKIALLGMISDNFEKEINELDSEILKDAEIKRKKGLLIYPSTRPLNRTLEYSSNPFIPGVTGNIKGVLEVLRETGLKPTNGTYKNLIELNDEEMSNLTAAILLRNPKSSNKGISGDIFLIKLFNKLEDARELNAMIKACSKLNESSIAIQLCMEIGKAKKKAEAKYIKYKQFLISGLNFASSTEKIQGKGFVIINTRNEIKDTMIETITGILSNSSLYEDGTIIITTAYCEDKIKISARSDEKTGRNIREVLNNIVTKTGGEVKGNEFVANATISQDKEKDFIELLKKNLEIEVIKV